MTSDNHVIHVTLDTNILQEFWRNQDNANIVRELLVLSGNRRIDLAVTTRIEYDTPRLPLADRIGELPALGVQLVGTAFHWGISSWGRGDFWSGEKHNEIEADIKSSLRERGLRVPETADFDHIFGHHTAGRDVFLTWDKAILRAADLFRDKLGVRIATPEDFIATISDYLPVERQHCVETVE